VNLATEEGDGLPVPFAAELWDPAGMWALPQPWNVVIPSAGLYKVHAWVSWDTDNDGYREVQVVHEGTIVGQVRTPSGTGAIAGRSNQSLSAAFVAAQGDVVNLVVSHSAGNALNADRVRLVVRRVGTTVA
jgi:hypothetical protein